MKHKHLVGYLAGLLAILVLAGIAGAQVSTNFNLNWHLLSSGGGTRNSTNYRANDV